jgi:SRSO17 transposase
VPTTDSRAAISAQHQSLLHFIGESGWSDEKVLAKVRAMVLPGMERNEPIKVWIIDDTGFPKQDQRRSRRNSRCRARSEMMIEIQCVAVVA